MALFAKKQNAKRSMVFLTAEKGLILKLSELACLEWDFLTSQWQIFFSAEEILLILSLVKQASSLNLRMSLNLS